MENDAWGAGLFFAARHACPACTDGATEPDGAECEVCGRIVRVLTTYLVDYQHPALDRAEKAEAERDEANLRRSETVAWVAQLTAERDHCIAIAGEALGTDPSLRTVACVEALASWCETLRLGEMQAMEEREASRRLYREATARLVEAQEMLTAANADCACLRGLLREIQSR